MSNHETELHDEMEIAEAQEMENPEEEESSVGSVEKATKATKKAPARKGDKDQGEKTADKADSGIVEAMKKKMKMAEEEDDMDDDDDDDDEDMQYENVAMKGNYARVMYDYRESYYNITVYKNGKEVANDDGYFGANETGNPLIKKFTDIVKKAGLKPEGLPIVDEDGKKGVFKNNTFNWNTKESYDFSGDLNVLIDDEATLSEEFKSKTAVIFEAAVKSKLREEVDRLEEQYEQRLTEELEQMSTDLIEKVDGYLDYVVDEWMKENEVAIQNGIRNEIAEGFMSGLKDLFEENYVDVPDSKIDLVDELAEQNEQLNEKANASIEEVLSLREELNNYKRDAIIREATVGLADTQADKLAKLVEDVDFVDEETFIDKVITIRDSYFSKKTSNYQLDEEVDQSELTEQTSSPVMQSYLTALRKSAKQ